MNKNYLKNLLQNQNKDNAGNFCIINKEDYASQNENNTWIKMLVDSKIYATKGPLLNHLINELEQYSEHEESATVTTASLPFDSSLAVSSCSFIPAVHQIINVASLPGIVGMSIALPDVHSGYGFPIGGVAAFDLDDPLAVVSPGKRRRMKYLFSIFIY